ncbi:MAG TPA: hypothetical protein VNC50_16735, partial [Planctomycetia bacterium]|nr:hypothetical protein [Planctomycetia bacterium]
MLKDGSGQKIGAQMVSATDGSAFTGAVTVYVTGDAGTQAVGSVGAGACTHEGNGYHTYAPAQAETNYDLVAFTFIGTGAVPATVQVYTLPATGILAPAVAGRTIGVNASGHVDRVTLVDTLTTYAGNTPQTGDSFARIGATGSGLTSLAPSATALSTAQWTNTRAGYLDNLSAGTVPTAALIAAAVEAAILNEGDATALLAAISAKVEEFLINEGDATATLAAIAAAVRTNLTTELARIDVATSTRLASASYTSPPSAASIAAAVGG